MPESISLQNPGGAGKLIADQIGRGKSTTSKTITQGVPWYIFAALISTISIAVGITWDISWHMSIGRDGLFSAPHLAIYLGGILAGLGGAYQMFKFTFFSPAQDKKNTVWFWGFRAPLASLICVWGALAMLTSAPFDDWWHNAYGLDVKILSPPHAVLLIGLVTIQIGALIQVLSYKNSLLQLAETTVSRLKQVKLMYTFTVGMLLVIVDTAFSTQFLYPNQAHGSQYYLVASIVFPIFLAATVRSAGMKWAATTATGWYTVFMLLMLWILPLFPATPLLGPVNNPITHFVPFRFPMLLIFPAMAIDLIYQRFHKGNDWFKALLLGTGFLLVILPVQWYFSDFYFSDYADNWFFAGRTAGIGYFTNTSWPYLFAHYPWTLEESTTDFIITLGMALGFAFLSARLGLKWGRWMEKVQR